MAGEWYYAQDGNRQGPVPEDRLRELAAAGRLRADDLVWQDGMADWTPASGRGFAQGITHSAARLGNALTPPLVAWLIALVTWRGSFVIMGILSFAWTIAWVWYFRDNPRDHAAITAEELDRLPAFRTRSDRKADPVPWGALTRRMVPVTIVYFCYGWTLWLYLSWMPQYFLQSY